MNSLSALLLASCILISASAKAVGTSGQSGLQAEQLAVVVNDADPHSVAVAEYYRQVRKIPVANIIHVRLDSQAARMDAAAFRFLRQGINAQLKPHMQAVLLVWTKPYAVECNAITSALSFGFDAAQCKRSCGPGRPSAYFNSESRAPYTDYGFRPTMLLPTDSIAQARALIDRGVASHAGAGEASAYYLLTSDKNRNSRAAYFPQSGYLTQKKLRIKTLRQDVLEGANDVMIYQTGLPQVSKLTSLRFLPGALADHLTSLGGDLHGTSQMSSLRWLDAGATASFGTVSEPCNYWEKFPQPSVLLRHYLAGATAIEAYWKSLAWPMQGLIIGEPLAAPYAVLPKQK